MKFVVYPSTLNGKAGFRWRLVGANGEKVASGEWYPNRPHVYRAIRAMKQDVPGAPVTGGRL